MFFRVDVTYYAERGNGTGIDCIVSAPSEDILVKYLFQKFMVTDEAEAELVEEIFGVPPKVVSVYLSDLTGDTDVIERALSLGLSFIDDGDPRIRGLKYKMIIALRGDYWSHVIERCYCPYRFRWTPIGVADGLDIETLRTALGARFVELPYP